MNFENGEKLGTEGFTIDEKGKSKKGSTLVLVGDDGSKTVVNGVEYLNSFPKEKFNEKDMDIIVPKIVNLVSDGKGIVDHFYQSCYKGIDFKDERIVKAIAEGIRAAFNIGIDDQVYINSNLNDDLELMGIRNNPLIKDAYLAGIKDRSEGLFDTDRKHLNKYFQKCSEISGIDVEEIRSYIKG